MLRDWWVFVGRKPRNWWVSYSGIGDFFHPLFLCWAFGLGWEVLPDHIWLSLRPHLCGAAGRDWRGGAATEDSSCGTALTVVFHEGSRLRQERCHHHGQLLRLHL